MTVTKGFIHAAATTALDTRKADEAKVATDAAGVPRLGVLTENPSIVTSDASTAPMRVAVAKVGFVTRRATGDGVAFWGNDGTVFVTVTAPASNSHYVVIWAKHNDSAAGDASSLPEIGSTTGAAAASPVVPSVPAGALALANVLVPSTATSTQSSGVVITNRYPMTAMRGGVIQLRNATEMDAWLPADGAIAYRQDTGAVYQRMAGAWALPSGAGAIVAPPISTMDNGSSSAGTSIIRDDVMGAYTFTAEANRRYRVVLEGFMANGTVAGDKFFVNIRNGGASLPDSLSPVVASSAVIIPAPGSLGRMTVPVAGLFVPGAGTKTLAVFCQRNQGSGVLTPVSEVVPRTLYVIDAGPA